MNEIEEQNELDQSSLMLNREQKEASVAVKKNMPRTNTEIIKDINESNMTAS